MVSDLMLKITGDSSDAEESLASVAASLNRFDSEDATAALDLNLDDFRLAVREAQEKIDQLSTEDASPEATLRIEDLKVHAAEANAILDKAARDRTMNLDVDDAAGMVELAAFIAEAEIAAKDRTMNLHVNTSQLGMLARLGSSVSSGIDSIGQGAEAGLSSMAKAAGSAAMSMGPLILIIGLLVVALVPLIASLWQAVGGMLALADAMLALGGPAIALGIGALLNFKDNADKAGTSAHKLKEAFSGLGDSFKTATAGGAERLFAGLADGVKRLADGMKGLAPSFNRLGTAAGKAFGKLIGMFGSPVWTKFFAFLNDSLAKMMPSISRSFGAFFNIMRKIAQAAMPELIKGAGNVADSLQGIAKGMDAKKLVGDIGHLVDQFSSWMVLIFEVGDALDAVFSATSDQGKSMVDSMAGGLKEFARWARGDEGKAAIKQFFEDVLNAVRDFLKAMAQVTDAINGMADAFGVLKAIAQPVVDLLKLPGVGPAISATLNPMGQLKMILGGFGDIFSWVGGQAKRMFGQVKTDASNSYHFVTRLIDKGPGAAWRWVRTAFSNAVKWVRTAASNVASWVKAKVSAPAAGAWRWVSTAAQNAVGKVRDVISNAWGFVRDETLKVAGGAWAWILDRMNSVIESVKAAVTGLVSWVGDQINHIEDQFNSLKDRVGHALPFAAGVTNFSGGMAWVGEAGPELVNLPAGSDVIAHRQSRRLVEGAGGGDINIEVAPLAVAEFPDPEAFAAQLSMKLRSRVGF